MDFTAIMDSILKGSNHAQNFGSRIRILRQRLKLTLDETAAAAGISKPFLSQIERGLAVPSVRSMTGIAQALGVQMQYFLDVSSDESSVCRNENLRFFCFEGSTSSFARLSSLPGGGRLESMLVRIPPGQKSEITPSADEEFLFVIVGEISVTLKSNTFVVCAGGSAHYASRVPYKWLNSGIVEAVALWVGTPTLF